jgi:hypothetical protein
MVEVTGFEPATFWSRSHPAGLHFIQKLPCIIAYSIVQEIQAFAHTSENEDYHIFTTAHRN